MLSNTTSYRIHIIQWQQYLDLRFSDRFRIIRGRSRVTVVPILVDLRAEGVLGHFRPSPARQSSQIVHRPGTFGLVADIKPLFHRESRRVVYGRHPVPLAHRALDVVTRRPGPVVHFAEVVHFPVHFRPRALNHFPMVSFAVKNHDKYYF